MNIYFVTSSTGRRMAYRFSGQQMRSFRMPLAEAELLIATGGAHRITGHPLKPSTPSRRGA